jgi:hypothetical protein
MHTTGEKLLKPHAIGLATCIIDREASRKIQLVPLSNIVIQTGI